MREVCEVCEFFVNKDNQPEYNTIYRKNIDGTEIINSPSPNLIDYLENQGIDLENKQFANLKIDLPFQNNQDLTTNQSVQTPVNINQVVNTLNNNEEIEEFL